MQSDVKKLVSAQPHVPEEYCCDDRIRIVQALRCTQEDFGGLHLSSANNPTESSTFLSAQQGLQVNRNKTEERFEWGHFVEWIYYKMHMSSSHAPVPSQGCTFATENQL